jgi:hypothetical protein
MSKFKEVNIEELQEIEVRQYECAPWERRKLLRITIDGKALCFLDTFDDTFAWNYYREIKEPTKREMTPFEAKVWCDENQAQMVYADTNQDIRLSSAVFAGKIDQYRYITNDKMKELKGQVTWEDCSEFPMVGDGELVEDKKQGSKKTFANWNNAPEWANYHAIDKDGEGYFFEHEPRYFIDGVCWHEGTTKSEQTDSEQSGYFEDFGDFRETLEERPEKPNILKGKIISTKRGEPNEFTED